MLDNNLTFLIGYDIRTPGHQVTQFAESVLPEEFGQALELRMGLSKGKR